MCALVFSSLFRILFVYLILPSRLVYVRPIKSVSIVVLVLISMFASSSLVLRYSESFFFSAGQRE
jgi:hypothetical protein